MVLLKKQTDMDAVGPNWQQCTDNYSDPRDVKNTTAEIMLITATMMINGDDFQNE